MFGIIYRLIVCMLVVLIKKLFKNKLDKYLVKASYI